MIIFLTIYPVPPVVKRKWTLKKLAIDLGEAKNRSKNIYILNTDVLFVNNAAILYIIM